MKTLGLAVVVAISITTGLLAGEIGSDRLIEGFIAVTQKAEGVKMDEKKTDEMRKALEKAKETPLFAPYMFKGEKCDRAQIVMTGPPTGDFHPICNAPMLGAHTSELTSGGRADAPPRGSST